MTTNRRRYSLTRLLQYDISSSRNRYSSSLSPSLHPLLVSPHRRSNLIFGANTDVGKTLVSAGLVRASLQNTQSIDDAITRYIKPLQCGGSDEAFVRQHSMPITGSNERLSVSTLFSWDTPTSPHTASVLENKPTSDEQVLSTLIKELSRVDAKKPYTTTYIETAGGVLSPSSASPHNTRPQHAQVPHSDDTSWGWQTQADLYQPLLGQLPVVLVGDGRLGGISATLSSLESLILRGYDIAALILIETSGYDNLSALRQHASRRLALRSGSGERLLASPQQSILSLPAIPSDPNEPLNDWYASDAVCETFARLDSYLANSWHGQVSDLQNLATAGRECLWWPFTQHGNLEDHSNQNNAGDCSRSVTLIDSAQGDDYIVLNHSLSRQESSADNDGGSATKSNSVGSIPLLRNALFDGCASWWTQGVGHGDSTMALASASAAGRYGHVIFPQVVHAPAVQLSQKLLGPRGPGYGWAKRVFFTDDGSTAMEVAIKMGLKLYQSRMKLRDEERDVMEWMVCAQAGCYHGDTLGVMDVAEPSIFNHGQTPWYEPKGLFLETPTLGFRNGVLEISHPEGWEPTNGASSTFESIQLAMDVKARMISRSLFSHYKETIELQWLVFEHSGGPQRKIGTVIIEPVLMGAGGMKFVDPLWQRALIEIAESRNVPVIFDEVASGLHRVGVVSCREIIGADPDIASYAKLLTGGLLPMSVTLATEETFNAFLGDEKSQALLHGHSYTGQPVGCVSALHALEAYEAVCADVDTKKGPRMWFDEDQVRELSIFPIVDSAFALGTVLAVAIKPDDGVSGYAARSQASLIVSRLRENGIYARPLGNVVYLMASPMTRYDDCCRLIQILKSAIQEVGG